MSILTFYLIIEITAFYKLKDYVELSLAWKHFNQSHNIWVIDHLEHADLFLDVFLQFFSHYLFFVHDFDCYSFSSLSVFSFFDPDHSALIDEY